jgi:hypothetical protein
MKNQRKLLHSRTHVSAVMDQSVPDTSRLKLASIKMQCVA